MITFSWGGGGVTVHTAGRSEEHGDGNKLNYTVFNINMAGQDKAGQTHRKTGSNQETRQTLPEQTGLLIHRIMRQTQLY